jgi:3D (Asp-Asp-Asp) domain-containing protein/peptidoglycan hydrolase CwlO-like protein
VRRVLVPSTGFLLLLLVPATGPAQSPGVETLQQRRAALATQSRGAVLQLYALESRLQRTRNELARIDARAAELARQQDSARRRYRAARATQTIAQQRLGRQLRILYEQDEPDPLAVVLGATSLADAIDGLDSLRRTARATESVVNQARSARPVLGRTRRELAVQVARTLAIRATVAATTAGLEQAREERVSYLAQLRREHDLTVSQIASLEQRAREAQRRARLVTQQASAAQEPAPEPTAEPTSAAPATADKPSTATTTEAAVGPSEPPPAPVESISSRTPSAPPTTAPTRPGGTMSVVASGYCLRGTTATGLPVGPGIVAVDPAVIPLGTRMTIPGYGEGVAADTGGSIKGARIDVWLASCAAARNFAGTITITFH